MFFFKFNLNHQNFKYDYIIYPFPRRDSLRGSPPAASHSDPNWSMCEEGPLGAGHGGSERPNRSEAVSFEGAREEYTIYIYIYIIYRPNLVGPSVTHAPPLATLLLKCGLLKLSLVDDELSMVMVGRAKRCVLSLKSKRGKPKIPQIEERNSNFFIKENFNTRLIILVSYMLPFPSKIYVEEKIYISHGLEFSGKESSSSPSSDDSK